MYIYIYILLLSIIDEMSSLMSDQNGVISDMWIYLLSGTQFFPFTLPSQ